MSSSGPDKPRRRRHRGLTALFAAGLTLALAGAGLVTAGSLREHSPTAGNHALSDAAGTSQVVTAVSAGLGEIYSYSYTDIPAAQRAARSVLTGKAATQYAQLSPVLRDAVSQRLTVRTRVVQAGVIWLSGDDARLLVFLDQTSTRGAAKATVVPAQLLVNASRSGGRWLISGIEAES